jgi:hypothetical protein
MYHDDLSLPLSSLLSHRPRPTQPINLVHPHRPHSASPVDLVCPRRPHHILSPWAHSSTTRRPQTISSVTGVGLVGSATSVGYLCNVSGGLGPSATTTSSVGSATADLVHCCLDLFLIDLIRRRQAFLLPPPWLPALPSSMAQIFFFNFQPVIRDALEICSSSFTV